MKKITLGRVVHGGEPRLTLQFPYDRELNGLVRELPGARWSPGGKYWHVPDNKELLSKTIQLFQGHAETDVSGIEIKSVEKDPYNDVPVIPLQNDSDSLSGRGFGYGTVLFTINERDGRLIVRFSGRYDKDWIRELKEYGEPYYDPDRKEWLLSWSQLAVDSLSDYFAMRGVEVIVRKLKVPEAIKEIRDDLALKLHSREASEKAKRVIDLVAEYLEEKRYSKRTIDAYLAHLGLFFRYFSDKDPDEISSGDVSRFLNEYIIGSGYSASYQNILISAIKIFFNLAGKGKLDADEIRRPRKGRALPKVLSKEEVMKVFSATRNSKHKLILWLIYLN